MPTNPNTQGPRTIIYGVEGHDITYGSDSHDLVHVATVYCPPNNNGAVMANALLIAAAPELLKALRELQANPNDPWAHHVALKAITKATRGAA